MGWVIFIIVVVGLLVLVSNANEADKIKENKSKLESKIRSIDGFNANQKIESINGSFVLSFDDVNKKIAYINSYYTGVVNYSEVVGIDIVKDNKIVSSRSISSTVGRAVVGGVLLGGVGAIAGAVTGKYKDTEYVSNVTVNIKTSNLNKAIFKVETFNSNSMCFTSQVKKGSSGWIDYEKGMKLAREIDLKVSSIIDKN